MKKFPRLDGTQRQIVFALRQAGCTVQSLAALGEGCPDLLVAGPVYGRLTLIEVKNGTLPPSAQRLTLMEELWIKEWKSPVSVCNSVDSALKAVWHFDSPINP